MAAPKYLKFASDMQGQTQGTAIETSAGAGDAEKIVATNTSGVIDDSLMGAATSGSNVVLKTGVDGRVDNSVLPVGIGADVTNATANETLSANDLVNFASDGGVRKADASNGRFAQGFVKSAVSSGATAAVYKEGAISGLSGLTPGARYFLSATVPGGISATAPTTVGHLWQPVGDAVSATELDFEKQPHVTI